jgi:hypothetical protein
MKKQFLAIIALILSSSFLYSQATKFTADEVYPFGAGLFVAAKAGVNTLDSPDGIKNAYTFSSMPDIGAQIYVPFGTETNLGATLDFAYLNHGYKMHVWNDKEDNWSDKLSYFSISPNIHISGFLIGMNIGIPLSASSDIAANHKYFYEYSSDSLGLMLDIHVGALVPIVKTEFGRLNLYVQAEYPLSGVFKNDLVFSNPSVSTTKSFNIQPVALKFGLSYIFNTGLLQK